MQNLWTAIHSWLFQGKCLRLKSNVIRLPATTVHPKRSVTSSELFAFGKKLDCLIDFNKQWP
jgi:hypothetical protein